MRTTLTSGLAALLMLTGCSDRGPAATAPVAPAALPAATAASLNGVARYFGAPMAGATVNAYLLGNEQRVASIRTTADGKFRLDFPPGAPSGALIKLVATHNGRKAASLARVPVRQVLQASDAGLMYLIDEQRSMVFLALGPRFEALGELSLGANDVVALSVAAEAFQVFTDALPAVASGPPLSPEAFEAAVNLALTNDGRLMQSPASVQAIARLVPPAIAGALLAMADHLAVMIRAEVAAGKPVPQSGLVGALPLGGDRVADEVFQPKPNSPEPGLTDAHSSDGVPEAPTADASGALDVTDGALLNPTAPPTISLEGPH